MVTESDTSCETRSVLAAVIVCGGRSRRMGTDKAWAPWGDETLLQATCRHASQAATVLAVVAAAAQELPALDDRVSVIRDSFHDAGPLGGLLTGLSFLEQTLASDWDNACVSLSACDSPFLNPLIISVMHATLLQSPGDFDAHVVCHQQVRQPLHAVYRSRILEPARQLFETGERSLQSLLCKLRVLDTSSARFAEFDPDLRFLRNINTPEELVAARQLLTGR